MERSLIIISLIAVIMLLLVPVANEQVLNEPAFTAGNLVRYSLEARVLSP